MLFKKQISERRFSLILYSKLGGKYLNLLSISVIVLILLGEMERTHFLYFIHESLAKTNPIALLAALTICVTFLLHPVRSRKPILYIAVILLLFLLSFFDFGFNFLFHNEVVSFSAMLLAHLGGGHFDAIGNNLVLTFIFFALAVISRAFSRYLLYQFLILAGLAIPFTASLGYAFDVEQFYFQMSVSTVIICFTVALSGLGLSADKGILKLFLAPNLVGLVARIQYFSALFFCITVGIFLPKILDDLSFFSSYEIFVTLSTIFISVLIYSSTLVLGRSEQRIRRAEVKMKELSVSDPLTGLYNRRGLDEEIEKILELQARYGGECSVLILDLDYFKTVNDRFGHDMGDQFLKTAAAAIKSKLRINDIVSRYGGEEFLVLLPNTSEKHAKIIAERLRLAIELQDFSVLCGKKYTQTVSIGGATMLPMQPDINRTLKNADKMLYAAKNSGRNCSLFESDLGIPGVSSPPDEFQIKVNS